MNQSELAERNASVKWAEQTLEILVSGEWKIVTDSIFRSWMGERRLNGGRYYGPVYKLDSNEIVRPFIDESEFGRKHAVTLPGEK